MNLIFSVIAPRLFGAPRKRILSLSLIFLLIAFLLAGCGAKSSYVKYYHNGTLDQALVCTPDGEGPFPAVIYNHGRLVDLEGISGAAAKGYDIDGICRALADEGYYTFIPQRKSGKGHLASHKIEIDRAIDYVKQLDVVDPGRIGLMGFSRGGLLTLMTAVERNDLKSLVILAPAPGRDHFFKATTNSSQLNIPVLILVDAADEDTILNNIEILSHALTSSGNPGRVVKYKSGRGHQLFHSVDIYWDEVRRFLAGNL